MNLAELIAAYKSGDVTTPMRLDNDNVSVCRPVDANDEDGDWEDLYDAHPQELLEGLLDYVGILHESV